MKTLYVSDLDGTLLTSKSVLSNYTKEIINTLVNKGMEFTFATARSINSASIVTKGLHLKTPLIVYNGAFLLDPFTYRPMHSKFFANGQSHKILQDLCLHEQYPFVYAYINGVERVSYIKDKLHEGGLHYLHSRGQDPRFRSVETMEQLQEGEIFYFTCIHDRQQLFPLWQYFQQQGRAQVVFQQELYRQEYWLELMPHDVSKANAISELKKIGQYDHIVSFGDAVNDLAMFAVSDECYAVKNAVYELKEQASEIIASNDEDAVAQWLFTHVNC